MTWDYDGHVFVDDFGNPICEEQNDAATEDD